MYTHIHAQDLQHALDPDDSEGPVAVASEMVSSGNGRVLFVVMDAVYSLDVLTHIHTHTHTHSYAYTGCASRAESR